MNEELKAFLESERYRSLSNAYKRAANKSKEVADLRNKTSEYMTEVLRKFAPSKRRDMGVKHENKEMVMNRDGLSHVYEYCTRATAIGSGNFERLFIMPRDYANVMKMMKEMLDSFPNRLIKRKCEVWTIVFMDIIELNIILNMMGGKIEVPVGKKSMFMTVDDDEEIPVQMHGYKEVDIDKIIIRRPLSHIGNYIGIHFETKKGEDTLEHDSFLDIMADAKCLPLIYDIADELHAILDAYYDFLCRVHDFYQIWFNRMKEELDRYMIAKMV